MPRPRFAKLDPAKQSKILVIAAEEFAENGFDGTSYNRIIERAGLSKGAMYYYFDDKTDLYATVLEDAGARLMRAVTEGIEAVDGYWERFEHMWKRGIAFALEHPEMAALARSLVQAPERARAGGAIERLYEANLQLTEQYLREGQATGHVRTDLPMALLVSVIFSMGEAIDRWWLERIDEIAEQDLDDWARELIGLMRRVAEPPAGSRKEPA